MLICDGMFDMSPSLLCIKNNQYFEVDTASPLAKLWCPKDVANQSISPNKIKIQHLIVFYFDNGLIILCLIVIFYTFIQ